MLNLKALYYRLFLVLIVGIGIAGCGGYNGSGTSNSSTNCTLSLSVVPNNVTLTHNSSGSSQLFDAFVQAPSGCTLPTVAPFTITWSTSDSTDVPISNAHDLTNGTATCLNPTAEPVTVLATLPGTSGSSTTLTGTANLICN